MTYSQIDNHLRKLSAINHSQSILSVDESVSMPAGGGEARAEAMGILAGIYQQMATSPDVATWIAEAELEKLDADRTAAIREFKRNYLNQTTLTPGFIELQTKTNIRCTQIWRKARPTGDWNSFRPALEEVVVLKREEAKRRAEKLDLSPYDALLEQYDPGSRLNSLKPLFAELKRSLNNFVPQALEFQSKHLSRNSNKKLVGPFPIESQKLFCEAMVTKMGFDFRHGRIDESHHPFCGGVPSDVRMTTRYRLDNFLTSLIGTLHETGHGMYEQGLPKSWIHWPVGRARGMATHESQSLLVEMQISRSREFWEFALPIAKTYLGDSLSDWTVGDVLAQVHRISQSLIRIEADEVTYHFHIIMRFEIEQQLVDGTLSVKYIPDIWDEKMSQYLGLNTSRNMKDGPMQDIHWASGAFGYFPSYTTGALAASQLWSTIEKTKVASFDDIRRGEFQKITNWLRANIWQRASFVSSEELIKSATGNFLSADYFIKHIERRYLQKGD